MSPIPSQIRLARFGRLQIRTPPKVDVPDSPKVDVPDSPSVRIPSVKVNVPDFAFFCKQVWRVDIRGLQPYPKGKIARVATTDV